MGLTLRIAEEGDEKSARRGTPQKGKKVETSDTPGEQGLF